jgi:hypothetical protein
MRHKISKFIWNVGFLVCILALKIRGVDDTKFTQFWVEFEVKYWGTKDG